MNLRNPVTLIFLIYNIGVSKYEKNVRKGNDIKKDDNSKREAKNIKF